MSPSPHPSLPPPPEHVLGESATTSTNPPSPTTLALAALNMTRDDLARHTDQMRCFLSAAAPPIHTLPQNPVIVAYSTHPSSSSTSGPTAVKSETTDPHPTLAVSTRPSMDAVLERGERRKNHLKRQYSNSIGSSASTGGDDPHQSANNSTTRVEDFPVPSGSGNSMTSATATTAPSAVPTNGLLYPTAPTPSDGRTVAKGASRSSSVCSSLAYQQDVFYSSRPPSAAPSHPSLRRSQSIASQLSSHQSGAGDDVGDPDNNSTVDETVTESVDEILGLAPAPSRQYNPESADAASSGQQTSGISLTMQTPVKAPQQDASSTPYQPVPLPSSSATRVGAYPSSSPVYKYQPATSPAGPRTPYRPPIHLKHPLTANIPGGRPRNAFPSSSPMPMPATSSPAHDSSPVNPASLPFRLPPGPRLTSKPHYSYAALIGQALMSSPTKRLSLNQIYTWISMAYPYFKRGEAGWQNSIRHNLSLNGCFVKIKRDDGEKGKGSWWSIREGDEACFAGGGFQRQGRANGRKRKGKAEKDQDAEAAETTEQDDEGASPKKKKKTASSHRPASSDPNSMIPRGGYSRSASTSTTATSVHTMASSASYDSVASYATGGYAVPIYYGATPYGGGYVQYPAPHAPSAPPFPSAAHAMATEQHAALVGASTERRSSTHVRTPASNGYALRPAASSHPSSSPLASRSTRSVEMSSEDEEEEEPESEDDQLQNASNRAMAEMRMPPHRSPVRSIAAQQSPTRSLRHRSPTEYMDTGRVQDVREMYEGVSHERHVDSLAMEEEQAEAEREQSPTAHDAATLPQDAAPPLLGQPFALNNSAATAVEMSSNEEGAEDASATENTLQPGFHFVPPLPKTNTETTDDTVVVKQEPDAGGNLATRGLDDEGFSNFFSSSPVLQRNRQNGRFSGARASGSGSDLLSRVIESKTAKRGSAQARQQSNNGSSPTKPIFPAVPTTPRRDTRPRTPPPPGERALKDPAQDNEEDRLLKEMDPTVAAAVTALTSLSPMRTPVSHAALHMSPAPPRSSDLAQYKHSLGPHSPFRTPGRTPSAVGRGFEYYDWDAVGGSADDSATKSMLGSGLVPRTPATPMTGGIFGSHNLYQSPSLPSPGWRRY